MSQVEFEESAIEDKWKSHKILGAPALPLIGKLLINSKIVKNEAQAYKAMIAIVIACLVLAVIIFYFFVGHAGHAPTPLKRIYS